MEAEDLAQVTDSLRRAVKDNDVDAVRRAVAEFGWHELLQEEAEVAVATLFSLQGEHLSPMSFLDHVLLAASELDLEDGMRVLLPHAGSLAPTSTIDEQIHLDGVVQVGPGDGLLVPCQQDGKIMLVKCRIAAQPDSAGTLDPGSGWVAFRQVAQPDDILLQGADAEQAWQRMSAAGRRALAHELVAIGGEMLRLTVDHVMTREQFGHKLASFQAVKHKLADVRLWQEVATLSAAAAWEDRGAESAALSKAAACRFSRTSREQCQQLLGGMGFTWEHSFHTYLRRALTLEPLLGGANVQHLRLGQGLREGLVPRDLAGL